VKTPLHKEYRFMLKLNKLFLYEGNLDTFDAAIEPTSQQRAYLTSCKNAIRDHLREGIKVASKLVLGMDKMIEPRFRTQGSWSYKTCLQVAHPPQEMDWDYGVYLPATTWENHKPRVAAKVYFELVEGLLEKLCGERGWKLLKGDDCKDTCIRVQVASWAHIDIPLYAAPETKFVQIMEKAMNAARADSIYTQDTFDMAESADAGELPAWRWADLDEIVMATRQGEWKESDPGAVSDWFNDRVREHGEQLRRICRYVKAWRDYIWPDGEGAPTSIMLMIAATHGFQSKLRRDDLALEQAVHHLATALANDIREVGIDEGKEDFNRLSPSQRREAAAKAAELRAAIRNARYCTVNERNTAIQALRGQFGERVPFRIEWLEIDGYAEEVRSTQATVVPPPRVDSTKAG
jgi:hypothetical protein